jgi:prophage regulatory protein
VREIQRRDRKRDADRERKREERRLRLAKARAAARQRAQANMTAAGARRILRLYEVEAITGLKKTRIYDGISKGTFPASVPLGERAVGWIESEILAWQEARMAARVNKLTEHKEMRA